MLNEALKKLIGNKDSRFSLDNPETLTLFPGEQRLRPRIQGKATILACIDGEFSRGTMLDVSAQGARCAVEAPPAVGSEVTITFQIGPKEFYTITGQTVRSGEKEIGLLFHRNLNGRASKAA